MTHFLRAVCLALVLCAGLAMLAPASVRAQYYRPYSCPASAVVASSYYAPAPVFASYYAAPAPVYTSYYAAPAPVDHTSACVGPERTNLLTVGICARSLCCRLPSGGQST